LAKGDGGAPPGCYVRGRMQRFSLGGWSVDAHARTLTRGQSVRRVSPKAMGVLVALAEADGATVSRAALMDRVWPDVTVCEDVLTHAVAELRKALEETTRNPVLIETVYKGGYRLLQPVRRDNAIAAPPPVALSAKSRDGDTITAFLSAQALSEEGGRSNSEESARRYEAAIAFDPDFAPAHAGLAVIKVKLRHYYGGADALIGEALQHAERAIELAPAGADGYAAHGMALSAAGAFDYALARFKTAIGLSPDAAETYRLLGRVFFVHGAYAQAVAACERAATLRADEYQCIVMGAKALRALGETEAALAWMGWAKARVERRLEERPDSVRALCNLFCCYIAEGAFDAAFALLPRLAQCRDTMSYYVAGGLAQAGEFRLALDQLESVAAYGWSHCGYLVHDPDLNPIRRDRRFRRIASHICA
jgi:DNA-binding winged helix-turn-helix (wHTH) protein/Flp pilus assembly protein TadD